MQSESHNGYMPLLKFYILNLYTKSDYTDFLRKYLNSNVNLYRVFAYRNCFFMQSNSLEIQRHYRHAVTCTHQWHWNSDVRVLSCTVHVLFCTYSTSARRLYIAVLLMAMSEARRRVWRAKPSDERNVHEMRKNSKVSTQMGKGTFVARRPLKAMPRGTAARRIVLVVYEMYSATVLYFTVHISVQNVKKVLTVNFTQ